MCIYVCRKCAYETLTLWQQTSNGSCGVSSNVISQKIAATLQTRDLKENKENMKALLKRRGDEGVIADIAIRHMFTNDRSRTEKECDLTFTYSSSASMGIVDKVKESFVMYPSEPTIFLGFIENQICNNAVSVTQLDELTSFILQTTSNELSLSAKTSLAILFFDRIVTLLSASSHAVPPHVFLFVDALFARLSDLLVLNTSVDLDQDTTNHLTFCLAVLNWVFEDISNRNLFLNAYFLTTDPKYNIVAKWIISKFLAMAPSQVSEDFACLLVQYPLHEQELLKPGFLPTLNKKILECVTRIIGLPYSIVLELQNYKKLHIVSYQKFVKMFYKSGDDAISLTLIRLCSSMWVTNDGREVGLIVTLCPQLVTKFGEDLTVDIFMRLHADKDSTPKMCGDYFNLMLDVESVEANGTSTNQELQKLISQFACLAWGEQLRNLNGKMMQIKFPEKCISLVVEQFVDKPYPLQPEVLTDCVSIYEAIMNRFYDDKLHHLTDKTSVKALIQQVKGARTSMAEREYMIKMIAVIRQAVYLEKGYYPFNTQVITVLGILLTPARGCLAEVKTGQGKSVIIAVLASYLCTLGKKIDIVTTSNSLAMRDAEEMRHFYDIFGITVGHNIINAPTYAESYANDIVYGTPFYFEYHIILDEYDMYKIRCARPYDIAIIDEVDSMMIDQVSFCTRIIYQDTGFWELNWVYPTMYRILSENPDLSVQELSKEFLASSDFACSSTFIKNFIITYLPYWAPVILQASKSTPDVEYTLHEGMIKPVCFESTGEICDNTFFISGMHQYLEVANGLYPSLDRLVGANLSHLNFFKRFKNVYGLSGTMGSEQEREEIFYFYQLRTFDVPVHAEGNREILCPLLADTRATWIQAVASEIASVHNNTGRPILVLLQSIRDTLDVSQCLSSSVGLIHEVLNGKQDKPEDEIIAVTGFPGIITLATNLAARGTDVRTNDATARLGGLHLVIGFNPMNSRVDNQARGRTARQGKAGTVRYIFNREVIPEEIRYCGEEEILATMYESMRHAENKASEERRTLYAPASELVG